MENYMFGGKMKPNRWVEFLKSNKGKGHTREELQSMYRSTYPGVKPTKRRFRSVPLSSADYELCRKKPENQCKETLNCYWKPKAEHCARYAYKREGPVNLRRELRPELRQELRQELRREPELLPHMSPHLSPHLSPHRSPQRSPQRSPLRSSAPLAQAENPCEKYKTPTRCAESSEGCYWYPEEKRCVAEDEEF